MKNTILSLVFSLFAIFTFANNKHIEKVRVNTKGSTIKWTGSKVSESHYGTVNINQGYLDINHGFLVGGNISIDMNSIQTQDMNSELNKKLDNHLKNKDFFNVTQHPEATIDIKRALKSKDNTYKILADLTIKGITHTIEFMADVKIDGLNFLATANIKIDRTRWGIEYNSGSFVDDLGDRLILDEIEFEVFLLSVK